MAWEMGNGTSAAASFDATRTKSRVQSSSSKTRRRVSAVRPEGPGVAFRVLRRLRMMVAAGSWSRLGGIAKCRGLWPGMVKPNGGVDLAIHPVCSGFWGPGAGL